MKNISLLFTVCSLIFLSACVTPRTLTNNEAFIKDSLDSHIAGEFSNSYQQTLFYSNMMSNGDVSMFEVTGYETQYNKGIVIGISYVSGFSGAGNTIIYDHNVHHLVLMPQDITLLLNNYKTLIATAKANKNKLKYNEAVYNDFTVSKNVVLSIKRKGISSAKLIFLINGKRVVIDDATTIALIKSMERFAK